MTDSDKLYRSWMINGSYFNQMLDCGERYNQWVEDALKYLPQVVLDENKENLVFLSTAERDGCRVARHYCENREIILLSERILPKAGTTETDLEVRNFIHTVLHEVVHAIEKHKSPKFDNLTEQEVKSQEDEADAIALKWFNDHVREVNNPYLKPITREEIENARQKSKILMDNLYNGV